MQTRRTRVFEDILYAQCWEDPEIDRCAFGITQEDTVFSITSGGCNVLTFLLDNPRKVIALDINPFQNALLELKMAAFQMLTYEQMLEFLGVRKCASRRHLYALVRATLQPESRRYWDTQPAKIDAGILHCGRYEHYMRLLRTCVTTIVGRSLIQKLFEIEEPSQRAFLFHNQWENLRWRCVTHILLSRTTMSLLFDKAFFRYVDGTFSFGTHFANKVKHAVTELPMKPNYFLSYLLLGRFYNEAYLPPYLRRENFEIIRSRLKRIEIVCDSCNSFFSRAEDSSITKFNFTNIFEWMSEAEYTQLLKETWHVARDGAIITYRNLLVPRERPPALAGYIVSRKSQAQRLHQRDLSFIYNTYVVEQINKRAVQWNIASAVCATEKP